MAAKKEKIETETRESETWTVSRQGEVPVDAKPTAPAVRVTLFERIESSTREILDYSSMSEFMGEPGSWVIISDEKHNEQRFKNSNRAFGEASYIGVQHVNKLYGMALTHNAPIPLEEIATLRNVLKDQKALQSLVRKGKDRVEYRMLQGDDLMIALQHARNFFRNIDDELNLAFRFRISHKMWTSGKDRHGQPIQIIAKPEKVANEKAEIYRQLLGYSPTILVTVSYHAWTSTDKRNREYVLHQALSHVVIDEDTGAVVIARPDVSAFQKTVEEFTDVLSEHDRAFVRAAIRGAVNHGRKLDFFGLSHEQIVEASGLDPDMFENTDTDPKKPTRGKAARIENMTAGSRA